MSVTAYMLLINTHKKTGTLIKKSLFKILYYC